MSASLTTADSCCCNGANRLAQPLLVRVVVEARVPDHEVVKRFEFDRRRYDGERGPMSDQRDQGKQWTGTADWSSTPLGERGAISKLGPQLQDTVGVRESEALVERERPLAWMYCDIVQPKFAGMGQNEFHQRSANAIGPLR